MSVPPPPTTDAPLPVLGQLRSRWDPPADSSVMLHVGTPLPANCTYLAGPPEEIGTIRSAQSNMQADKGAEAQTGKRLMGALGGFFAGVFLTWYIGYRIGFWDFIDASLLILGIGGVIGAIVGYIAAKPKYETSYVGEHGIAAYKYGGRESTIGKADIFLFERGDLLQTQQTRNYYNGIYTGTTYSYIWNNAAGKPEHRINGTFKHKEGRPPIDDPYWYAVAAENAWSQSRLPLLREKLANGETAFFPIKGKGAIGISRQGLSVQIGRKQETIPLDTIGNLGIHNGEVTISRAGAKKGFLGIGADGIYKFPYNGLGNARLCLILLSELIGQAEPKENAPPSPSEMMPTETTSP